MKRAKLPVPRNQRRKQAAPRERVYAYVQDWHEQHRAFKKQYWVAYEKRLESDAAYATFEEFQARLHAILPVAPSDNPYDSHKEPLEGWRAFQRMCDNRPTDWDILIGYLERDPFTKRSGYNKQKILRHLKRATLSESQRERLRKMLLVQTTHPPRREIREYCRLAIVLDTPEFRHGLTQLVNEGGTWAGWVLSALRRTNDREPV